MRYTYFPKQELKFTHPENMFLSFFLDGWSDRAVRWVMRGFDAADSERTVRPESPTSPNVEIGPTAKNLRTQCSREDCEQGISHRSNLTLRK